MATCDGDCFNKMDNICLEFNLRQMDILTYRIRGQLHEYEKNRDRPCCCILLEKVSRDNTELLQYRENGARAYIRLHSGIHNPEPNDSESITRQVS